MNYNDFLKLLAIPYSHWKFTKPRPKNGTPLTIIVDTFYSGNPTTDSLVLMDIRQYKNDEPRTFTRVLALDFFTEQEKGTIVPFLPKL